MATFDDSGFRTRMDAALKRIRTVLDNARHPQYPADVPHRYDDKYLLAEAVTRTAVAAVMQGLEVVGATADQLGQLRGWARTRSVTLRLVAEERCTLLRETKRKVDSGTEVVTEVRGILGKTTRTDKVVTTITEWFWGFEFDYKLIAFPGTATDAAITLHARSGKSEIKTTTDALPRPKVVVRSPVDLNLTWLLGQLDGDGRAGFSIDRGHADCHTPRRNRDVDRALDAFAELAAWCGRVEGYFRGELFLAQQDHGLDLGAITDKDVFVPVLPLFEEDGAAGVLPTDFAGAFLAEARRTLDEACRTLSTVFPRDGSVITAVEAALLVTLAHLRRIAGHHADAVQYVEQMLRDQLIAAIGKELGPADFTAYMEFHHRKLVAPAYRPLPFSYAIRRPDHDPEGVLAIEAGRGDAISTTVRRTVATAPMHFALDASTRVAFLGDRHLHAWIAHQFSGQPAPTLALTARARQFSSFIVLVGRIASADTFEPRLGVIVKDKDLVKIPLLLDQLPTPKEFRDAIESLSPEQQRFAKAFRGMQLESTLFGVCVIQIKPQLEKLLRLPPDALTKEIRLTQELLDLFIQYQIPSDLLSYDGPDDAPTDGKLERVKLYVARMFEMIELSKQRELEEERQREAMRLAEQNRTPPPSHIAYAAGPPPMPPPAPGGGPRAATRGAPPPAMSAPMPASMPVPMAPMPMAAPGMAAPPPPPPPQATAPREAVAAVARPPAGTVTTTAPAPAGGEVADYTRLPAELDRKFEALDTDGALRATIINPGDPWTRVAHKGLLGGTSTATLGAADQKTEKSRAFDLLDALTKSGALSIDDASLHVVLAATHCFDRTLVDTVIQDNVNPIEKVERSLMIVGTTVHGLPAAELLAPDQRERFFTTTPQLGDGDRKPEG